MNTNTAKDDLLVTGDTDGENSPVTKEVDLQTLASRKEKKGEFYREFQRKRAMLTHWLLSERLFVTFSLLKMSSFQGDINIPTAGVSISKNGVPLIRIGYKFVMGDFEVFKAMVMHELRHIYQLSTAHQEMLAKDRRINICADAALHEDVRLLCPKGFSMLATQYLPEGFPDLPEITEFLKTGNHRQIGYEVYSRVLFYTVESLSYLLDRYITDESRERLENLGYLLPRQVDSEDGVQILGRPSKTCILPRGKDLQFYYNVVTQAEYKKGGDGDTNNPLALGAEGGGGKGYNNDCSIDEHGDFSNLDSDQAKELLEKAANNARRTESEIGKNSADMPLDFLKGVSVRKKTLQAINAVKLKASYVSRKKIKIDYNYRKGGNRVDFQLPGEMMLPKSTKKAILLLDTSGSMNSTLLLSDMNAAVMKLYKQDKLLGAFSFDAELYDLTLTNNGDIAELRGGGGTVISDSYLEQIYNKCVHKTPGGVNITVDDVEVIVLTDDGIQWDVTENNRKKFHVIDITEY